MNTLQKTVLKLDENLKSSINNLYPYTCIKTPYLTPLDCLFLLCTSDQQNNTCSRPSNEHSYQVWF